MIKARQIPVKPDLDTDEYKKLFRERVFYLRETGISPRVFNLWKKSGLVDIPFSEDGRGWIKLNFADYVWLKIVQDLRKFGCSLEDIKNAKFMCFDDGFAKIDEALFSGEFRKSYLDFLKEKKIDKAFITKADETTKQIEKIIKDKYSYKILMQGFEKPLNNLETFILDILAKKSDAYLMFRLNQTPVPSYEDMMKGKNQNQPVTTDKRKKKSFSWLRVGLEGEEFPRVSPEEPHLKISLKHYIREFIKDETKEKYLGHLKLLQAEELELLKQIRLGKANKIEVFLKEGKIDRIDVTRKHEKDAAARLTETFTSHEYANISYQVANGKIVHFEKTTKIKPNEKK